MGACQRSGCSAAGKDYFRFIASTDNLMILKKADRQKRDLFRFFYVAGVDPENLKIPAVNRILCCLIIKDSHGRPIEFFPGGNAENAFDYIFQVFFDNIASL
jgi:hypothetical protein